MTCPLSTLLPFHKSLDQFKGKVSQGFLLLVFFMNHFPQAPEYPIRVVSNFCENSWRHSQLKVHHGYRWHRWQMEKIFNHKNFNCFVWKPLESRVNLPIHFCLQVHFKVSAAWYWSHYLPPVSLTQVANLLPVSLIPVVHLDLRISPRIFEKIWNSPNGILWGWGETDSWKKPEAKNLVTLSL